jgi:large subunit ribosomal protein L24
MKTKKPNKTRKHAGNLGKHKKSKAIAANLSERLRKEKGTRSISLRKGDTVKIVRGSFKGKEGKIKAINREIGKVFINGIIKKKSDGTEFEVAIDPSNLMVRDLESNDKKRLKNIKGEKK